MLAKEATCDAVVVGLIGERGREVREFIEETLGEEGLKRAIVVVATSDEPALTRRQAAYMTLAISEYLRDQDLEVLCLMDSVTRFAMAQREIGLAAGEPPTTKGLYAHRPSPNCPSCWSERVQARSAPTARWPPPLPALFTVLVDGDDHNEPIADATRGILDGHIVMERAIARARPLPGDQRASSRSAGRCPGCQYEHERHDRQRAPRQVMAAYANMEELIRIGAYRAGADPVVEPRDPPQPRHRRIPQPGQGRGPPASTTRSGTWPVSLKVTTHDQVGRLA